VRQRAIHACEVTQALCKRCTITLYQVTAGPVLNKVNDSIHGRCKHWEASGCGLKCDQWVRLVSSGQHEHVCGLKDRRGISDVTEKVDTVGDT
jgi:hypothetical protein